MTYKNGDLRHLMVGVTVTVGSEADPTRTSPWGFVEFENDDGVYVTVSGLGPSAREGADGEVLVRWPGCRVRDQSPASRLLGTAPVPSVTLRGGFCGENKAIPLTEAPYDFTPDCEGFQKAQSRPEASA